MNIKQITFSTITCRLRVDWIRAQLLGHHRVSKKRTIVGRLVALGAVTLVTLAACAQPPGGLPHIEEMRVSHFEWNRVLEYWELRTVLRSSRTVPAGATIWNIRFAEEPVRYECGFIRLYIPIWEPDPSAPSQEWIPYLEPVYCIKFETARTYIYEDYEWQLSGLLETGQADHNPYWAACLGQNPRPWEAYERWPHCQLGDNVKTRSVHQKYYVYLVDSDSQVHRHRVEQNLWENLEVNQVVTVRTDRSGAIQEVTVGKS